MRNSDIFLVQCTKSYLRLVESNIIIHKVYAVVLQADSSMFSNQMIISILR